jgi:hypothetical protein
MAAWAAESPASQYNAGQHRGEVGNMEGLRSVEVGCRRRRGGRAETELPCPARATEAGSALAQVLLIDESRSCLGQIFY